MWTNAGSTYLKWSRHLDWDSDFSAIKHHSSGWVARLEIFDIDKSYDNAIACLEMDIDKNEVFLQLTQSLMCSSSGAVLQFPISLSGDGQAFTILRTVYLLEKSADELGVTSHVLAFNPPHNFWQPRILPGWKDHAHNLYLYWIYFDDRGHYLCLAEQFANNNLTVNAFKYNRIRRAETPPQFISKASISLEKAMGHIYPGRNRKAFELAYHPSVASIVVADCSKSSVYLWNFESSRPIYPLNGGSRGKLEMLSFTSDGKSVVGKRSGNLPFAISVKSMLPLRRQSVDLLNRPPEVSALSGKIPRGGMARGNANTSKTPKEKKNGDESRMLELSPPVSSHAATFAAGSGAIRSYVSGDLLQEPGENKKEVLLMVSDKQVVVSRVPLSGNSDDAGVTNENDQEKQLELRSKQNLLLTRIPNWGFKAATPTVVFPREEGDPVRIVLDKDSTTANRVNPSESSSSASGGLLSHQNSPVIVERHIRSIQRQNQYSAHKSLLLSSSEQLESDDIAQLDEDAETSSTSESWETSSITDEMAVITPPPPAEVDEGSAVSMPLAPRLKTSTTESLGDHTGPAKEKSFQKRYFGTLAGLFKRKPKI
jgi:hypothetical protein